MLVYLETFSTFRYNTLLIIQSVKRGMYANVGVEVTGFHLKTVHTSTELHFERSPMRFP